MKAKTTQRLDKLKISLEELLRELSAHSDDILNTNPGEGHWSVLQTMHHVLLAEGYAQSYLRKKLSFDPDLPNAGLADSWRVFLLWLYLHAPFKFKAPDAVSGENLPTDSTLVRTSEQWLKQRQELITQLESFPPELFNKSLYRHPFAGKMTLDGMLVFFQAHFDRHRKQMARILEKVKA